MAAVAEIGGDPVHVPQSEREVEAIIRRLGEEGIETVVALHRETGESPDETCEAPK